jgi:hypothetical protein
MKKYCFTIIILMIVGLLTLGCQAKESLVFDNTCVAPCWRQIQPGKTTEKEVSDLLAGFPDIKAHKVVHSFFANTNSPYLTFELPSNLNVTIGLIEDRVAFIQFDDQNGIATFGNCVQRFGAPEFVVQSSIIGPGIPIGPTEGLHTWFYALNKDKGIIYGYDTYRYFGKNTVLAPTTMATEIEFYDVDSYETLLKNYLLINVDPSENFSSENLYPWAGYGNLDELYPEK